MNLRDHRIDFLRGLSIFVVLLLHFHLAYRLGPGLLFQNGNYGVTIFFVISGYLITSTSLRRFGSLGNISVKRFYSFRFARIYPCLLLVLAAITIPGLAGIRYFASNKPVSFLLADFSVLTFWHNILMAHAGYFNYGLNILWSLSVEEVFYLLFPLLCLTFRNDFFITGIWFAAILYAPIYRSRHPTDDIQYLYANFSCFDSIAMGCLAALYGRRWKVGETIRSTIQVASLLAMSAVFFYASIGANLVWGPSLISLAAAAFVSVEGSMQGQSWPFFNPLQWLGRHSYELYLFHIVVLAAMRNMIDRAALPAAYKWPWFVLFLGASALVAWLVARFYSEPANRRLRKLLT